MLDGMKRRTIVATAPRVIEWQEEDLSAPTGSQVLVRSERSVAKHGTEMAGYLGAMNTRGAFDADLQVFAMPGQPPASYRFALGNMYVGLVEAVGPDVTGFAAGDRVFGYGAFSDYHLADASALRRLREDVSSDDVFCWDPAQFALGAVRDGHVRVGDYVVVFGMGAIGLMTIQLARVAGASRVVAVEPLANRRELAASLGADRVLDPAAVDAGRLIKEETGGRGADVCIDFSGSHHALQAAIRACALGGTVAYGAFPKPFSAGLDLGAEAHLNTVNVVFTRACTEPNRDHPRWDFARIMDESLRLLEGGIVTGRGIVTPEVPFDELASEYPKIETEPDTYIKLAVRH